MPSDASSRGGLLGLLARIKIDVSPLRSSKDFRVLLVAGTVFYLGQMVGYVALPFQVYELTGSSFAVGGWASSSWSP